MTKGEQEFYELLLGECEDSYKSLYWQRTYNILADAKIKKLEDEIKQDKRFIKMLNETTADFAYKNEDLRKRNHWKKDLLLVGFCALTFIPLGVILTRFL